MEKVRVRGSVLLATGSVGTRVSLSRDAKTLHVVVYRSHSVPVAILYSFIHVSTYIGAWSLEKNSI